MKSGTETKLKFKQLQRRLSLALWQARGLLDTLWSFAANNCPAGDIGRFSDEEIAIGIDWQGDPGELIETLVSVRWLDQSESARLVIHDWPEHCEDTVHKALARKTEVFADGSIPHLSRFPKEERAKLIAAYQVKYGEEAVETGRAFLSVSERLETPKNAPALPSLAIPSHTLPSLTDTESPNGDGERQDLKPIIDELVSAWNATPGVIKCRDVTPKRLKMLRTRLRDPAWAWRDALKKFPLRCFAGEQDSWKPDIEWFLGPDAVTKVIEGKYDWEKKNAGQRKLAGAGINFDETAGTNDPNFGKM